MGTADHWKLLVFREGRRVCHGPELLRGLVAQIDVVLSLSDFSSRVARDELIDALLRAGELECALRDADDCADQAGVIADISVALAAALISKSRPQIFPEFSRVLEQVRCPRELTLSIPEGFCYYALHPLDYASLLSEIAISPPAAAVIGIRSIGSTLSAVVCAWFRNNNVEAERISVRPAGHPFDRHLSLNQEERNWIAAQNKKRAQFLIVDEGPGLSGSSFLAVAEALVGAGVLSERIMLLPSSSPNLDTLLAPNASRRWSQFRTIALKPTRYIPAEAGESIGGGAWRHRVFESEADWPGVWPWTERQKYFSQAGNVVFRFDGHGHYGKAVRKRSTALAEHGWGPETSSAGDGFSASAWLTGTKPKSVTRDLIVQLAGYCAFRAAHVHSPSLPQMELEQMVRINLERALEVSRRIELPIERPVIADGRMMPYEWIQMRDGRLQKLDASDHGDNHFFPGPTDIAWDLAGAVVEWKLNAEQMQLLISKYQQLSRDVVDNRLPSYLIAYSCFRMAFAQSAANSMAESKEKERLQGEATQYRSAVVKLLERRAVAPRW